MGDERHLDAIGQADWSLNSEEVEQVARLLLIVQVPLKIENL